MKTKICINLLCPLNSKYWNYAMLSVSVCLSVCLSLSLSLSHTHTHTHTHTHSSLTPSSSLPPCIYSLLLCVGISQAPTGHYIVKNCPSMSVLVTNQSIMCAYTYSSSSGLTMCCIHMEISLLTQKLPKNPTM